MRPFLQLLPLELSQVKDFIDPESELESGDHVVGVMTDDQKALYTRGRYLAKESMEALAALALGGGQVEEKLAKSRELRDKSQLLNHLFWITVQDHFDLWDKSVGARKGFQIVWMEEKEKSRSLGDILKRLLQGKG